MNTKRKAICLALILSLFLITASISVICHIASSFNEESSLSYRKEEMFIVKISGAVKNEGNYSVKKDTSVYDCLSLVGGIKKNADLSGVNLLKTINGDCDIFIPRVRKGDIKVKRVIEFSSDGAYMQCNINKADESILTHLSGIGNKTAANIIAYREINGLFKTKEELLNIKGIGIKTYNRIKDCITVGGEQK